jgi:acetoacetyl-CoA synthetase
MAVLFQQGTIANLARLLDAERRPEPVATALPLHISAPGRPLFMMPTIVGELIFAPTLIQKVGARFPVVGIQPALVHRHLEHFRDFRETAAHFVAAMRAYQPRGPYALVGFSYGGLMAFEVASILLEAGEEVDLLAVIDTGFNNQGLAPSYRTRWRRLFRVAVNFPSWLREELADLSVRRLFDSMVRTVRRAYRAKVHGKRLELDDVFDVDHMHAEHQALMRTVFAAVRDYVPRRYPGTMTLIRATAAPLLRGFEPDLGWHRFAEGVEIHHIKGNHDTILRPHRVGELADHLVRLLDRRTADPDAMKAMPRA